MADLRKQLAQGPRVRVIDAVADGPNQVDGVAYKAIVPVAAGQRCQLLKYGDAPPLILGPVAASGLAIGSTANQFPVAVAIAPSSHPTSQRAGVRVGDWQVLQDINGDGTKDFALFNHAVGAPAITSTATNDVSIGPYLLSATQNISASITKTDATGWSSTVNYAWRYGPMLFLRLDITRTGAAHSGGTNTTITTLSAAARGSTISSAQGFTLLDSGGDYRPALYYTTSSGVVGVGQVSSWPTSGVVNAVGVFLL